MGNSPTMVRGHPSDQSSTQLTLNSLQAMAAIVSLVISRNARAVGLSIQSSDPASLAPPRRNALGVSSFAKITRPRSQNCKHQRRGARSMSVGLASVEDGDSDPKKDPIWMVFYVFLLRSVFKRRRTLWSPGLYELSKADLERRESISSLKTR